MAAVDVTRRRRVPGLEAPTQDDPFGGGAPEPPPFDPPKIPGVTPPAGNGPSPSGPQPLPNARFPQMPGPGGDGPAPDWVPPANPAISGPAPTGFDPMAQLRAAGVSDAVAREELDSLLSHGGDAFSGRLAEALPGLRARSNNVTSGRLHDSQGPAYNQQTNQLNPAFMSNWQATFDDPWTAQLEALLAQQMEMLNRPNPQLQQLTDFLNSQFQNLSQAPGYSPEEMAVLRTQAFEPVESMRAASRQRALERAGARGMLPSSGLHELDMRDIDIAADRNRTALDRDLSINQIGERNRDLAQAAQAATMAYQVPHMHQQQQLADILSRSQLLYQLPRNAMMDAQSVLGGSPGPESLFNQMAQQAGVQLQQGQFDAQRNAQVWSAIGQMLANWWRR